MKMKVLFLFLLTIVSSHLLAQDPVSWSQEIVQTDDGYYVSLKAEVQSGWYIYSMHTEPGGPIPTEVNFTSEDKIDWSGELTEQGEVIKGYDELFELEVAKYKDKVQFNRSFSGKSKKIMCEVTYMTCDSQRCLPPKTLEFEILN